MFRSFVLRSLLVFVFSTAPFAGYAFTPSTDFCGGGFISIDNSDAASGPVASVALVQFVTGGCGFSSFIDVFEFDSAITITTKTPSIVVINNTNDTSSPLPGVYVIWAGGSALTGVNLGGVPVLEGQGVVDSGFVAGSGTGAAFYTYVAWTYLGVSYYVTLSRVASSTTVTVGPVEEGAPSDPPVLGTLVRTTPTTSPGIEAEATFTVTFNEPVQNVDVTDFVSTKGTVSVAGSGDTYTVTVSGIAEGETADLSFAAGQNITDMFGNALATPTTTASYTRAATQTDQLAIGRAGSLIASDIMRRTAVAFYSSRLAYRFGGQGNGRFNPLAEPGVAGWTTLDSDTMIGQLTSYEERRNAAKLERLSPDALALASDMIDFKSAVDPLDFYVAGGWGDLNGTGAAGYDGQASYTTIGVDYMASPDFVAGFAGTYEWSRIDFDTDANGVARKDGWRGDGYFGWAVTDDLVVEGWGSYGYLDNMILSNSVVGRTDSHRTMLGAKMIGDVPVYGTTISPYVSASYAYEFFEHYTASNGTKVAAFDTETSQGAFGLELHGGPSASVFGLEPYIGLQGEWDWLKGDDLVLPSGDILKQDDWGVTWRAGVQGSITGFAPGTWVGSVLEGSQLQLEIMDSSFGRTNESLSANWNVSVPL